MPMASFDKPEFGPEAPFWLVQLMDAHAELSRAISRFTIAAVLVSLVVMGVLASAVGGEPGGKKTMLAALLAGLWVGAFIAGAFYVFARPSDSDETPAVGPPVPTLIQTGMIRSPTLFVRDLLSWRQMASSLEDNRRYPAVRQYLGKDKSHVVGHLIGVGAFYLLGSVLALLLLLW